MKKIIEKWAVNSLYINNFTRLGRINKKKKKIIFDWCHAALFKHLGSQKEHLALAILNRWLGYRVYEEKLCLYMGIKPKIKHTWGEVQDIIRAYNTIPILPGVIGLSDKGSNLDSSEPKSDVLPVTPSDN